MKKPLSLIIAIGLPFITVFGIIFRNEIEKLSGIFPRCWFHKITGGWCPGCGDTRSLLALLHGDVMLSARQNITVLFLALLVMLIYCEAILSIFGKNKKLVPRKLPFWLTVIGLFFVYFILRNFIPEIAPI